MFVSTAGFKSESSSMPHTIQAAIDTTRRHIIDVYTSRDFSNQATLALKALPFHADYAEDLPQLNCL